MKSESVLSALSSALVARSNCVKSHNNEWFDKWDDRIDQLVELLPSGSGFDSGTKLDDSFLDHQPAMVGSKLRFITSFHHMNDNGMYDGWTEHTVTVTATFSGFDITVSGRNRNDIKELIADCFHNQLSELAPEPLWMPETRATALAESIGNP